MGVVEQGELFLFLISVFRSHNKELHLAVVAYVLYASKVF